MNDTKTCRKCGRPYLAMTCETGECSECKFPSDSFTFNPNPEVLYGPVNLNIASSIAAKDAILSDAAESLRWMIKDMELHNAADDSYGQLVGVPPQRSPELQKAVDTLAKIDWLLKS